MSKILIENSLTTFVKLHKNPGIINFFILTLEGRDFYYGYNAAMERHKVI